jgi:HEAT repeat protein
MPLTRATAPDRAAAASARADQSVDALARALDATDPAARRDAARALAAHPAMAPLLADRVSVETDHSVRDVLLGTLAHIGSGAALRGLVQCLRSEDVSLRNAAVRTLQGMPDGVAAVIDPLLRDADVDVRLFALDVLRAVRHPAVEQWGLAVLRTDTDANVCAVAAEVLGELGSADARESLLALPGRFPSEPYVAFAANHALTRLGTP